jgi:hypothetical protein
MILSSFTNVLQEDAFAGENFFRPSLIVDMQFLTIIVEYYKHCRRLAAKTDHPIMTITVTEYTLERLTVYAWEDVVRVRIAMYMVA